MCFKTNSWLDELMKKHPKCFFAIGLIVSILVILISIGLLIIDINDISVPVLMLVAGAIGIFSVIFLKVHKD